MSENIINQQADTKETDLDSLRRINRKMFENAFTNAALPQDGFTAAAFESAIRFGEPGEVSQALDQNTKDAIILTLAEAWQKREAIEPGTEKQVLHLHKKVGQGKISSEVMISPNGEVAILVMPKAGYDLKYFPFVSHALVHWNPEEKKWVVEKSSYVSKMVLLKQGLDEGDSSKEIFAKMLPVFPRKSFGKLGSAMAEAQNQVARNGFQRVGLLEEATPEAQVNFRKIPSLTSLQPSPDEMLAYAQDLVENHLPSLFELIQKLGRKKLGQNA